MATRLDSPRGPRVRFERVAPEVVEADVAAAVAEAGLTMSDFVKLGRAGRLEDDRLRDLWLIAGGVVVGRRT